MGNAKPHQLSRMVWLDCLRLLASISMVGLHASSDIMGQPFPDYEPHQRIFPVLFRSVAYLARTELFIIISLFLLIWSLDSRSRGYRATVFEQMKRLMLPFSFWVVFYAFFRLIKANYFGYESALFAELASPWAWVSYFTLGTVQYHMHFLPTLFLLVLFYPFYRIAVRMPSLGLLVLLSLFVKREADVFMWAELRGIYGFEYLVRGVKVLAYVSYGIVAASFFGILKRGFAKSDAQKMTALAMFICGMLYIIKLIYSYKVIHTGHWNYNYTPAYWADFLIPIALFGIFMGAKDKHFPTFIGRLAPFGFGIYLVHPIFLDLLEILLWHDGINPSIYVATKAGLATVLATVMVMIISKFTKIAWIVGLGKPPRLRIFSNLRAKDLAKGA
ncbi:membrane protein [Amylibacter ulvae]|uniref:Membrane protein n=1 Tax=Paramylibacter ulvae TaxID=1651968 RepID=A0ABQ3D3N4_9RHOB|nr:acyltransferase [Amylibacter ulvae]GHA56122.1 membrane protein [Amylibacter ulvae]